MNLRDKISFNASQKDLEVLLAEPFDIDINDIPVIYVVGWNYTNEKTRLLDNLDLEQRRKDVAECFLIGKDESSEKRIALAYLYPRLKEEGISEDLQRDVKTIYDGIMFNHGGLSWDTQTLTLGSEELIPIIHPEYVEKIQQFESRYKPALERIKQSGEHDNIVNAVDKYILGNLSCVQSSYDLLRGKIKERYKAQIADALGVVDEDTLQSVEFRGCHNMRNAYNMIASLLKEKK